jgi:hypothetical protein
MRDEDQKLLDWVNQTGFPLQIALADRVNRSHTERRWKVKHTEHSWKNANDGQAGFIDIVLRDDPGTVALVVKCKRTLDSSWIFLMPDPKQLDRRHVKAWITWSGAETPPHFGWRDVTLDPRTPQSQFCVIPGQDPKAAMPMLERIGGGLVSATEAFATEERGIINRSRGNLRVYCSVIATTAKLYVCQFDPSSIPLDTGKIPTGQLVAVPAVRFRKQLSVRLPDFSPGQQEDAHEVSLSKEHTVFIVNAEHFIDFLNDFDIDSQAVNFLA